MGKLTDINQHKQIMYESVRLTSEEKEALATLLVLLAYTEDTPGQLTLDRLTHLEKKEGLKLDYRKYSTLEHNGISEIDAIQCLLGSEHLTKKSIMEDLIGLAVMDGIVTPSEKAFILDAVDFLGLDKNEQLNRLDELQGGVNDMMQMLMGLMGGQR